MLTSPLKWAMSSSPQNKPKATSAPDEISEDQDLFFSATPGRFKHFRNSVFYVFESSFAQIVHKQQRGKREGRRGKIGRGVHVHPWPSHSFSWCGPQPQLLHSPHCLPPSPLFSQTIPRQPRFSPPSLPLLIALSHMECPSLLPVSHVIHLSPLPTPTIILFSKPPNLNLSIKPSCPFLSFPNHLGILLNCKLFQKENLRVYISNKFPGNATGLRTTLELSLYCIKINYMCLHNPEILQGIN